jgi:hypothetical protein
MTATEATIVAVVERQDRSVGDLGLTLAEGRVPARRGSIDAGVETDRGLDGGPDGMLPLRLGASAQGQPIDRDADCVRQGRGAELEVVGMQLRGQAMRATPVRESTVQGRAAASHPGTAVPSGQVGCPSTSFTACLVRPAWTSRLRTASASLLPREIGFSYRRSLSTRPSSASLNVERVIELKGRRQPAH